MKIVDLRSKTDSELKEISLNARKDLFKIRIQASLNNTEALSQPRFLRKKVAQVETILKERSSL